MAQINILQTSSGSVATPASGSASLFVDSTNALNIKTSSGTIISAGGPGGSDGQFQFNNAGVLGGVPSMNWSTTYSQVLLDDNFQFTWNPFGSNASINASSGGLNLYGSNAINILSDGFVYIVDGYYSTQPFTIASSQQSIALSCYLGFGALVKIDQPGTGLAIAEGSNCKQGIATLSSGTVTVSNTSVTANSRIQLTIQDPNGGTPGAIYISARTAGTSFDITSTSSTDTSIVAYFITEPA